MAENKENSWFEVWFDSPYYHILYGNRDYQEADAFVKLLVNELQLPAGSPVLDLACGKGRHSISMNKLGLEVLGVDLAAESIREAKKSENDKLHFEVHDMREIIENRHFRCVFNLFTSFGYFDSDADNLKVLQAIHSMLLTDGILLIDFMNAQKVIRQLVTDETKTCAQHHFSIKRQFDGTHIVKKISFVDADKTHAFEERVQALTLTDFENLLELADFTIQKIWGSYKLDEFDAENSDRLLILASKR